MIDFELPADISALGKRVREFVRDEVIPRERDPRQDEAASFDELRRELQGLAHAAGLLTPHGPTDLGGLGLDHVGQAVLFEEAGYSPLGPLALNISAPDEGNVAMLSKIATPAQREQWLRPLVAGEIRSCFGMTEPAPGAGSDPSALATHAVRDGDEWVINGTKWLITGAEGASVCICMARVGDEGATMFLVPMDAPGLMIERSVETIDTSYPGGHGQLRFDDVRVGDDAVLGEVGEGFRYAQVRLAPARLTHCMRHLGSARRAHDIAVDYARTREAFGQPLARHEGVGFMLADNEMDMRMCRLVILETAWVLDQGERATTESSQAKVMCSEAIWRIVDRCVQILGGTGVSDETIVQRIFRDVRPFRIYDGPSEVHRWSLARKIVKRAGEPAPR